MAKLEKSPGYAQNMLKMLPRYLSYIILYFIVFQSLNNDWVTWTFLIPSRGRGELTIQKKRFRAKGLKGFWSLYQAREDGVHVV